MIEERDPNHSHASTVAPEAAAATQCQHGLKRHRPGTKDGAQCHRCGRLQLKGSVTWVCSAGVCSIVLCPTCNHKDKQAAKTADHQQQQKHTQEQRRQAAEASTSQGSPQERPTLLPDLVAALPEHPRMPTLARVPRGVARRYARMRTLVLEWMLDASDAGLPEETCVTWSTLARMLPWIILHDDRDPEAAHLARVVEGGEPPTGARRRVVDRLHMAEQGQWHALIAAAIAAEEAYTQRTGVSKPHRTTPPQQVFNRVVRHALTGSLKAAKRLLTGVETLPPGQATTEAVLELYKSRPEQACGPFPSAPAPGPRRITTRDVTQKVRALRTSAQPGPNQERNAHVQDLLQCPRAASVLARWCEAWRTGSLPAAVRQQWLFSHVVALDKGEGKARPILLQEAMLKLATGVVVQISQRKIQRAVGEFQHGLGGSVGAPQVVWQVRAAMEQEPFATFLGIDCRNAFGTISRRTVVEETDEKVPQLGTMLRAMWEDVTPHMLIRQADGTVQPYPVVDGLAQGGCDSQPAFCLGIGRALRAFQHQCKTQGIQVRIWAYVDDVVLQVAAEHTHAAVQILDTAFAAAGLERRPDKCKWFVPGAAPQVDYPPHVGEKSAGGLPILGSVADGALRTVVTTAGTTTAEALQPATDRLTQAKDLAKRIHDLLHADCDAPVLHAAYKLVIGTLNQALSYDICVLPLATIGPLADSLDTLVIEVLGAIVGDGWKDDTIALLRLPRSHGGCGVQSTADRAHTAFLGAVLRCPPSVTTTPTAWQTSGVLDACQQSIQWLQNQGVWLDSWAMPRTTPPHESDALSPHHLPPIPLPRRQQGWRTALADARTAALAKRVEYLESRAGPEGGALLTANAGDMQVDLTDDEFRTYIRMRLGLTVCKHQRCQHHAVSKEKTCPQVSDPWGYHALMCKLGGGLTATHNAICTILMQAARAAGYVALKEQVVAELATVDRKEPRVDVDAWGLVAEPRILLDVTVTCPFAQRYEAKNAVASGEARKDREYPSKAGLRVTGVAVDVYGRHGPALGDLLTRLGDLARQHDLDCGSQPRRWIHRWRVRIATELARGCVRQVSTANYSTAPVRSAFTPMLASATHTTTTTTPAATVTNVQSGTGGLACVNAPVAQVQLVTGGPACAAATHTTTNTTQACAGAQACASATADSRD